MLVCVNVVGKMLINIRKINVNSYLLCMKNKVR